MSTSFASFRGGMAARDRQTESDIVRTDRRLKSAEEATMPGHTVQNAQDEAMLPARLTRDDADENRAIYELPDAAAALGYRAPQADERLARYIQKKREDARFVDRERWIAKRFDLSAPEKAAWFNQIMPSFLERRKRFGESKLGMQKQLFDITLYGPQSEEDLDFLFAIDTGAIDLEELSRPIWEADDRTDRNEYIEGMFAQRQGLEPLRAARNQGYDIAQGIGTNMRDYLDDPGARQDRALLSGGRNMPGIGVRL